MSTRSLFYQLILFSPLWKSKPFPGMINKLVHWRSGPRLTRKARVISDDENHGRMTEGFVRGHRVRLKSAIQTTKAENRKLSAKELAGGGERTLEVPSKSDIFKSKVEPQNPTEVRSSSRSPLYGIANRQKSDLSTTPKTSIVALPARGQLLRSASAVIRAKTSDRLTSPPKGMSSATGRWHDIAGRKWRITSVPPKSQGLKTEGTGQSANWVSASGEPRSVDDGYCHTGTQIFGETRGGKLTSMAKSSRALLAGFPGSLVVNSGPPRTGDVDGSSPLAANEAALFRRLETLPGESAKTAMQSSNFGGELWLDVGNLGNWLLTYLTREIARGSNTGNQSGVPI